MTYICTIVIPTSHTFLRSGIETGGLFLIFVCFCFDFALVSKINGRLVKYIIIMEGENSLQTPFCEGKIIYFLFPNNNREVINKLMFLFSGHRSGYFLTQQVPIQKSSLNGLKSCFNARSQKSMTLILTSNVNVNVYLTFLDKICP